MIGRVQTSSQHYGSSLKDKSNGTCHQTSTFVTRRKAYDSVDRRILWKLLRHYGVPEKIVNIIRNSYDGIQCNVMHEVQMTDVFQKNLCTTYYLPPPSSSSSSPPPPPPPPPQQQQQEQNKKNILTV
ncbi:unnamed protein product [Schistosoma curassoni]|uniref:Reverse transcriptase domain-containing protein n=1 Tax=Schistosoma curassoni TaxID=6186 RepID=A0A183JZJ9_9TREM|nr:unnamed protein product [Schistosoma curassoni]